MKNILKNAFTMFFLVSILATPLVSEEVKNMSIMFDPMGLLNGAVPLTFRIRIAERISLGIIGYDKMFSLSEVKVMGVGGGLSGKFHLSAPAFSDGWYLKPEVMGGFWTVGKAPLIITKGIGLEPRLMAGYDWVWTPGFSLSLGLGIKYVYFTGKQDALAQPEFGFHQYFPNLDLGIGWSF